MEVTFLKAEQLWGDKALQVMKPVKQGGYGTTTCMSDLAIVLGGLMGRDTRYGAPQKSGYVWSASKGEYAHVRTVGYSSAFNDDGRFSHEPNGRCCGARPALPPSTMSKIRLTEAKPIGDVQVVKYGEYPQTIAKDDAAKALNGFSKDQLEKMKTGKQYTFDDAKSDAYETAFTPREYPEYQHSGKKYICVASKHVPSESGYKSSLLSNGRLPKEGHACWIEVQPIEWLKDPSGWLVARQALFSGIRFDKKEYYYGDFDKTEMKHYLQNYFAKEIQLVPILPIREWLHEEGEYASHYEYMTSRAKDLDKRMAVRWPEALRIDHRTMMRQLLDTGVYEDYPKAAGVNASEEHFTKWLDTTWEKLRRAALDKKGLLATNGVDERAPTAEEKAALAHEMRREAWLGFDMPRTPDRLHDMSDDALHKEYSGNDKVIYEYCQKRTPSGKWRGTGEEENRYDKAINDNADIVAEQLRRCKEAYNAQIAAGADPSTAAKLYDALPDYFNRFFIADALAAKYQLSENNWPGKVSQPTQKSQNRF